MQESPTNQLVESSSHNNFQLCTFDEFEVVAFSIGQSTSSVQLVGVGFHNTVFFEFYEDGEPLNPYVDKRFNWYL